MGRILKWLAYAVGAVVLLVVIAIGAVYAVTGSKMSKHWDIAVQAPPIPSGAAAITEGQRIFTTRACADCHGTDLGGKTVTDNPVIGRFAGANLTTGKGGQGGSLSDADIVRAVRHGVHPSGRPLGFMPSTDFHALSDADIGHLIAFIRSVPPVDKPTLEQKPGPLARILFLTGKMPYLVSAEHIDHSAAPSAVAPGVTTDYGRYLANGCTGCHGAGFSGGPIAGAPPEWLPAGNITPNPETGLGRWSEADFIKALREGKRPDGTELRFPMPWRNFSQLNDTELRALWAFLRTVPAKAAGGH